MLGDQGGLVQRANHALGNQPAVAHHHGTGQTQTTRQPQARTLGNTPRQRKVQGGAGRGQRQGTHTEQAGTQGIAERTAQLAQGLAPAGGHGTAFMQAHTLGATFIDGGVQAFGLVDLFLAGFDTHRGITGYGAIFVNGYCHGVDPVKATVLAAVLDHAHPGALALQGVPEILEGFGRHIGVTHNIVCLANQLLAGESANRNKGRVRVGDPTFQVGL